MNPQVSIAISRSHSLRGFSMNNRSIVHPAQLTRTWTPPIELSANSTVEATDSQSVTSVWRATMVPDGASDSTFLACSSSTSAITTRAPSFANPRVIARPRFDAPPVTMTTRPVSPRSIAGSLIGRTRGREPPGLSFAYFLALASPFPFSDRMNVAASPSSAPPPPVTRTSGITSSLPSESALAMATAAVGVEPRLRTWAS